jgi:Zn-finger nucleic acid-binding protein
MVRLVDWSRQARPIVDDAGAVRSLSTRDWRSAPAWSDARGRVVMERALAMDNPMTSRQTRSIEQSFFAVAFVGVLIVAAVSLSMGGTVGQAMILPLVLGAAVVAMVLARAVLARTRPERDRVVLAAMTHAGLCPCCAHELPGASAANGQRVICTECGSVWNAQRIVAPITLHSPLRDAERHNLRFLWLRFTGTRRGWIIKDDAGERTAIFAVRPGDRVDEPGADESLRERRRDAERRAKGHLRWLAYIGVGLVVLFLGSRSLGVLRTMNLAQPSSIFAAAWPLMLCVAYVTWLLGGNRGLSVHAAPRVALDRGLCPSCAGDLQPVSPDDDGLTRCPDCGAAWDLRKKGRIVREL